MIVEMLIFRGTLVHSTWTNPLEILSDILIGVDGSKITFIRKVEELEKLKDEFSFSVDDITNLNSGEFLIPGFIDTHVHAPQYLNAGKGLDVPLLDWLEKYTLPLESRFKDIDFAGQQYEKVVTRLLKNGTTTACYFATIHLDATLKLCDIIAERGQRAFVGKSCRCSKWPEYYTETPEESVVLSERFVEEILNRKNPLVLPILSPGSTLGSTLNVMSKVGEIARAHNIPIQSHLNEAIPAIKRSKELFPDFKSATHVYDAAGLLTNQTVMAHGVYLGEDELELLRERETAIAHCPNSNLSLKSGLCDVRRLLDYGIKVGLGTDISGGYHPSILDAIRACVSTSIAKGFWNEEEQRLRFTASSSSSSSPSASASETKDYRCLDYREAFRLATLAGSQALGLSEKLGNFEVGKDFDALRINVLDPESAFDVSMTYDSIEDQVEKFLYIGDDRNIAEVYVAGKKVHSRR